MARLVENVSLSITAPRERALDSGGGAWPLQIERVEDWAWFKDAFSTQELDSIINIGNDAELERGITGSGYDSKFRESYVHFMFPNEYTGWIFERLTGVLNNINEQFFKFDLTGFEQGLQFTRYEAPAGHYDWHIDRGLRNVGVRKMSLTLQLNDPSDYEGGELELRFGKDPIKPPTERGMITFFPSYVLHRVTPVTKGTRYSLVAWISGPPFK